MSLKGMTFSKGRKLEESPNFDLFIDMYCLFFVIDFFIGPCLPLHGLQY